MTGEATPREFGSAAAAGGQQDHSTGADGVRAGFYVSVVDGRRRGLVTGPYPTREQADADVDRVRAAAAELDSWAHFYDWGSSRVEGPDLPAGRLNDRFLPVGPIRAESGTGADTSPSHVAETGAASAEVGAGTSGITDAQAEEWAEREYDEWVALEEARAAEEAWRADYVASGQYAEDLAVITGVDAAESGAPANGHGAHLSAEADAAETGTGLGEAGFGEVGL